MRGVGATTWLERFEMTYTLEWEKKGVYKRFSGNVSFQEYARSQTEVLSDARADDIRYVINDLLDMTGYSVTEDEAEYAAAYNRASSFSNPDVRIAYVTTDLRLRMLLKLSAALSAYELRAFDTLADAREWACAKA